MKVSERKHVTIPEEISHLLGKRAKSLGYRSVSGYLLGLVLYDLWCRKPHALTQPVVNADQAMRDAVCREIAASFNDPERPSSYFERRLREIAAELKLDDGEEGR